MQPSRLPSTNKNETERMWGVMGTACQTAGECARRVISGPGQGRCPCGPMPHLSPGDTAGGRRRCTDCRHHRRTPHLFTFLALHQLTRSLLHFFLSPLSSPLSFPTSTSFLSLFFPPSYTTLLAYPSPPHPPILSPPPHLYIPLPLLIYPSPPLLICPSLSAVPLPFSPSPPSHFLPLCCPLSFWSHPPSLSP